MKAAMGGLVYGSADVMFFVALSVASGIFAVSQALGAQSGWPLRLSVLPVILVVVAYLGYLAAKSRLNSDVNVTRRKEYRMSLITLLPVVLVVLALRHWADRAGMSYLQFGGAIGVVMGCSLVMIGVSQLRPSKYPRSYWLASGFPMIAGGLVYPFCTRAQGTIAVSCMATLFFGLLAIVMYRHLRQQSERAPDADN